MFSFERTISGNKRDERNQKIVTDIRKWRKSGNKQKEIRRICKKKGILIKSLKRYNLRKNLIKRTQGIRDKKTKRYDGWRVKRKRQKKICIIIAN